MKETTVKMKLSELKMDWNYYPRRHINKLDSTNLKRMKEALKAGEKFPPIRVNKKNNKIADGAHRVNIYESMYGINHEIDVVLIDYKNDNEMYLDSIRVNSVHGLPLGPKDQAHVIISGKKYGIPIEELAKALGISLERFIDIDNTKVGVTEDGEEVPISGGYTDFSKSQDIVLSEKQVKGLEKGTGLKPVVHAKILMNSIKSDLVTYNEHTLNVFRELRDLLDVILRRESSKKKRGK